MHFVGRSRASIKNRKGQKKLKNVFTSDTRIHLSQKHNNNKKRFFCDFCLFYGATFLWVSKNSWFYILHRLFCSWRSNIVSPLAKMNFRFTNFLSQYAISSIFNMQYQVYFRKRVNDFFFQGFQLKFYLTLWQVSSCATIAWVSFLSYRINVR